MLTSDELVIQFERLGITKGDVILIRASLGAVGRMEKKASTFIDALLNMVGEEGTIVSLAFTNSSFIKKAKIEDAFDLNTKSYAGALPNAMINHPESFRSKHPTCSFVAIGKHAKQITDNHDASSPAYEPVRKIIDLGGKCVLVGCVKNSPGFTTTHLAEYDLCLTKLRIFPSLNNVYYKNDNGSYEIFKRKDPGFCSNSFSKFYSYYVAEGILRAGHIGDAYSIICPAKEAYEIDKKILSINSKFNICGSKDCFVCNAGRWDTLHKMPGFILRKLFHKMVNK